MGLLTWQPPLLHTATTTIISLVLLALSPQPPLNRRRETLAIHLIHGWKSKDTENSSHNIVKMCRQVDFIYIYILGDLQLYTYIEAEHANCGFVLCDNGSTHTQMAIIISFWLWFFSLFWRCFVVWIEYTSKLRITTSKKLRIKRSTAETMAAEELCG